MSDYTLESSTFDDIELLAEVSQLLTMLDLEHVLQRVMKLVAKAVGATQVSLFLHEDDRVDWDHIFTVRDLSPDESVRVVKQVLDAGFAGWVYRNKQGDIIRDTETDERWIIFPNDPIVTRSALCAPFLYNDRVIAVVTLIHPEPDHFSEYHLQLMTIIANQATIAIRNAQLFNRMRQQQHQLEAILQSIADILLVLDRDGSVIMLNNPALSLMREERQSQIIGRHLRHFVERDKVFDPINEIISADLNTNNQWSFETRSESQQRDFQVRMSVWEDQAFSLVGYVVVMHDITMLRDLHRFKDEMLRVATHDLRSPLALISGYADMILMDTPDSESPIHEHVETIKAITERMGYLVEDLLRVERIRNSPLELHERTDITAIVKVVLVNMRPAAQTKNLEFRQDAQLEDMPRLVVDPVLIRQAMENFINNAIKYTPENGVIVVKAYYKDEKFYYVVEDSGIGIPQEHLPYIFESFYRVKTVENTQNGSGLGLSLVSNVIKRHEGEVWVKSVEGKGSQFGFWIPLRQSQHEESQSD